MSKVYVLTASYADSKLVVGVFSSYSAMMTYLYDLYRYEASYSDHVVSWSKTDTYGCFVPKLFLDGKPHTLRYEAHDLIGETSHKTDKLVIKPR